MNDSNREIKAATFDLGGYPTLVRSCGDGGPIMLLHAGVADSRMWGPLMADLCDHYQLIAPDLRGFGGSIIPARPFAYHEELGLVMDRLEIDQAWIVAASFGTRVAVDYCLVYPKRVAGLVLAPPVVGGFKPGQAIEDFNEEEELRLEAGDLEGATSLNVRTWLAGPHRQLSDIDANLRLQVAQMQREAFQVLIPEEAELLGTGFVALERLDEIACPTLVLSGDKDFQAVYEHAEDVAGRIPNARFELLRGVGHLLSLENPAHFNKLVREFVINTGKTG
jgi:3-oxoadipate enol-lactonase